MSGNDGCGGMQIGVDAIRGEPEFCLFGIGTGQLVGRCVGRDPRTGRFVSLTKERRVLGAYTTHEPLELERRANPRSVPAVAARLVVCIALVVITATPKLAVAAAICALLLPTAKRLARAGAGYVHREFLAQWRLALVLAPFAAALVWLAAR